MFFRKNLHLILSVVIVTPAALFYGLNPSKYIPQYFDFDVATTDLNNVFRAIMCLYLAFAIVWVLGIVKSELWKTATILNLVFMAGLGLGRSISMILDGVPSLLFEYGVIGEMILALFAAYQLRRFG